jgi:hypothetical protein
MMAQERAENHALVLVCGKVFDGISDALTGPAEILIEGNRIAKIERSVERPRRLSCPGRPLDRQGERGRRGAQHGAATSVWNVGARPGSASSKVPIMTVVTAPSALTSLRSGRQEATVASLTWLSA